MKVQQRKEMLLHGIMRAEEHPAWPHVWVLVGVWRPSSFSHFKLYSMENIPRVDERHILKCVLGLPQVPPWLEMS